jgi:hypothetical protein
MIYVTLFLVSFLLGGFLGWWGVAIIVVGWLGYMAYALSPKSTPEWTEDQLK